MEFINACIQGNIDKMRKLIEKGDIKTFTYKTSFCFACEDGQLEIIKLLIDCNKIDFEYCLEEACRYENIDVVELLIKKINKSGFQFNWNFILNRLFYNGNLNIIEKIIEKFFEYNVQFDLSMLFENACYYENINIVKICIEKSTQLNTQLNWEYGLIKIIENIELFNLILEKTTELNIQLRWDNILYWACRGKNIEIVKAVLKKEISNNTSRWDNRLRSACSGGNIEIIKLIIEKGTLFNTHFNWNQSLYHGCFKGHLKVVKFIFEKIIETNTQIDWELAFKGSCEGGNIDIVNLIFEKNANNNINEGLEYACRNNCINVAKLLIEKGANSFNEGLSNTCLIDRRGFGSSWMCGSMVKNDKNKLIHLLIKNDADITIIYEQNEFDTYKYYIEFIIMNCLEKHCLLCFTHKLNNDLLKIIFKYL